MHVNNTNTTQTKYKNTSTSNANLHGDVHKQKYNDNYVHQNKSGIKKTALKFDRKTYSPVHVASGMNQIRNPVCSNKSITTTLEFYVETPQSCC